MLLHFRRVGRGNDGAPRRPEGTHLRPDQPADGELGRRDPAAIQGHQATLVRALDELGESVARYDEKVDERAIAAAMAEVVARQPQAPAADYSTLKSAIAAVEKGTNLSES